MNDSISDIIQDSNKKFHYICFIILPLFFEILFPYNLPNNICVCFLFLSSILHVQQIINRDSVYEGNRKNLHYVYIKKVKGKAIPVTGREGP
jgi:hypothetical protein